MFKMKSLVLGTIIMMGSVPIANAQSVTTQDISAQLQSSLEASSPTVVYFDFDKDELKVEAQTKLAQQASWLMSNPEAKVNLAGHADAVGADAYNINLAMRRAQAVENYLFSQGVNPAQMQSVVSRGESELAVQTQSRERLNRRVTTSVTGLVEIYAEVEPTPDPTPLPEPSVPPRQYAETSLPACTELASLSEMSNLPALSTALEGRLKAASMVYMSEAARGSNSNIFDQAAFAKAECGIAIGYLKANIKDKRSIENCACYSGAGNL